MEDLQVAYCTVLDNDPQVTVQQPQQPQPPSSRPLLPRPRLLPAPRPVSSSPVLPQGEEHARQIRLTKREIGLITAVVIFAILSLIFCVLFFTTERCATKKSNETATFAHPQHLPNKTNNTSPKTSDKTEKCDAAEALGMQSGKIQDSAITASSYHRASWAPYTARLRRHICNCAWAPSSEGGEWLQVDLGLLTTVTAIATQGRCEADAWVKTYMISYSNDAQNWSFYYESGSKKIFNGNTDRNTVVNNSFDPHIHARYMRILPQSWYNGHGDLRIEYYGCPYKN